MAELSGPRPVETGIRGLLQDPNYLVVWVAGGLMGVIRWFQLLALGIYTFEITGSPLLVSMVPVLYMLPLPLFGPVMGVIADRVNRKLLLVWATVGILAVAVSLALLAHAGDLGFLHVALAAVAAGFFWTTDMPVRRRLLGDLSGSAVSAAMGLDSATNNATRMAGPLLGGVMLQLVGMTGVFALSAAVYAVCLLLIVPASLPGRGALQVRAALLHDLLAGALFVIGDRVLRRILIITIVFNMFGFPFTSMIPVIGAKRLGLDPFMVGVLSSLEGFGAFVGALMVAMWARPEHFFRIYFWGTVIYLSLVFYLGVLIGVAGGPYHSFLAASATLAVIGLASACFAAMQGTLTYLCAPPEYRSRVLGVLTLCIGTGPVGFFLLGWVSESYGVPWGLVTMAGEGLLILLLLWLFGSDSADDDRLPPER